MTDGYCQKHFISYCPELSKDCPYCILAAMRAVVAEHDASNIDEQDAFNAICKLLEVKNYEKT